MIFELFTSLLLQPSALNAAVSDLSGSIQQTVACHRSFEKHSGSPAQSSAKTRKPQRQWYEVYDLDNYVMVRTNYEERSLDGKSKSIGIRFSITDGQEIYGVKIPAPTVKRSDGTTYQALYRQEFKFRLVFPAAAGKSAKSYCAVYEPRMGLDDPKEFELSPPASCPNSPAVNAVKAEGREASERLTDIQNRIAEHMGTQLTSANRCLGPEQKCDRYRPAQSQLIGFTGEDCEKLSHPAVRDQMVALKAYVHRYGGNAEASSAPSAGDARR